MAKENVTRKLAAVLAADVAGYTRLMEADEETTLENWWSARNEVIDPSIDEHGGRIVKHTGDGFLAEFSTATEAVRCAVAMQNALLIRHSGTPEDKRFAFRMGINLGEIVADDEDIYGDGVNIAARIESLAEPGGIWISANIHEQVHKKLEIPFLDMGERTMKNLSSPVRVFRIVLSVDPRDRSGAAARATSAKGDKPTIAVLPFTNLSGDADQEYFADGITEDLITALSNVQSFFVIARNSTYVYKGRAVDVKQVSRDLGAHYVMEGSVRKAGNRVRVSAQLLNATEGTHVWGDRYDGALDDIFDLQDKITANVVGAIEPQFLTAEAERIKQKHPESLDAYDYTLRGLALMNALTPEDADEALRLFRMASEIDPSYGRPLVCASWCYRRKVQITGMNLSDDDRDESLRLANAALKVGRTDPYVMWQAGLTFAHLERKFDEAMALIDRSLSVNANSNRAWLASAMIRCMAGDPEGAIDHAERARLLSPLETSAWVADGALATAHMQEERYEQAVTWARNACRANAYNAPAYHVLAASSAQIDRMDDAKSALDRALELNPDLTVSRLREIYPIENYRNLDGFLTGLRLAGLAE